MKVTTAEVLMFATLVFGAVSCSAISAYRDVELDRIEAQHKCTQSKGAKP